MPKECRQAERGYVATEHAYDAIRAAVMVASGMTLEGNAYVQGYRDGVAATLAAFKKLLDETPSK